MAGAVKGIDPVTEEPIDRLLRPFHRFMELESAGGIALLLATLVAVVWANSPYWESYHHLWETPLRFGVGGYGLEMTLHHLINDGLMAVFFFLVGLEIKREMLVGELATPRAAALPIMAAMGGMVVPAGLYVMLNAGGEGSAGWGIPMATDIAFALGILALMGPRVPVGLKIFLTALAIVDDLGAVLVIALFYTSGVDFMALTAGGAVLLALIFANRAGVRRPFPYALLGLLLWGAFLASGIHATVAGVLLALTVPARTRIDTRSFLVRGRQTLDDFERAGAEGDDVLTNGGQQWAISRLEQSCEDAQAPLVRVEHDLQPWVAFGIIPIFALANAGVHITGDIGAAFGQPVTLGVILGLVAGKPIGITFFSWVAVRTGLAVLPPGVGWHALHAVSWLGGIGFTMSLFVAGLAFGEGSELLDAAKIGILAASAVAAIGGWILLRLPAARRDADPSRGGVAVAPPEA